MAVARGGWRRAPPPPELPHRLCLPRGSIFCAPPHLLPPTRSTCQPLTRTVMWPQPLIPATTRGSNGELLTLEELLGWTQLLRGERPSVTTLWRDPG